MKLMLSFIFGISICLSNVKSSLDTTLSILILSQNNSHHLHLATDLEANIKNQAKQINWPSPNIYFLHRDFDHVGGWTILPILPQIVELCNNSSWIVIVEDRTNINLKNLIKVLNSYDSNQEIWIGYCLYDREPTIIHHFAFAENSKDFPYPNSISGFAFTIKLIEKIAIRWKEKETISDFSIDYAHELSLFIWNNGKGPKLIHDQRFCVEESENCVGFPKHITCAATPTSAIYFAVKTCRKFHQDRVEVVKATWGRYTPRIDFFSDVEDTLIPTRSIGVPNTERGHCAKTMKIIKYISQQMHVDDEIEWGMIVDDDTILSVAKLQDLLGCFNPTTPILLGERYGYNVHSKRGYNYITGGGGMALSRSLVKQLANDGVCDCPSISSPDDMFLGLCTMRMGVEVVHMAQFHQARPMDYSPEYLKSQGVVSFHKHWMLDPFSVYKKWFFDYDNENQHTEL